nr:hypothetical protein [Kutzneria chonburiensis]
MPLKLRDTAGLDRFLAAVADRHSPEYGHYLTLLSSPTGSGLRGSPLTRSAPICEPRA